MKRGTEFSFHNIPPCLIPRGWTNDPRELEACLGLNLHGYYSSFPAEFSPVLCYMGVAEWSAYLVCEGSDFDPDFYLITSDDRVFRLDTAIELLHLIVWMKAQVDAVPGDERETTCGLRLLLENPVLEWQELCQDEWTERCTQATS